ncbi:MAG: DUF2202 domain-containing protein [Polyangiaceae bacterium]|nr:DUF2202 domain-containing protein [Polyangiaceae bacterium]
MRRWWMSAVLASAVGLGCSAEGEQPSDTDLSSQESASLKFMREEEKLARDVYSVVEHLDPSFVNVGASEQTHMDAILTLLDRYGLSDPAAGKPKGEFTDPALQSIYNELARRGVASQVAALQVGVEIEELDIRDIENAKNAMTHSDIQSTYDSLLKGSRNHLRTFYGKLQASGGTYTPQYIDAATFAAIVGSARETGK